jgi:hypothetical protein
MLNMLPPPLSTFSDAFGAVGFDVEQHDFRGLAQQVADEEQHDFDSTLQQLDFAASSLRAACTT